MAAAGTTFAQMLPKGKSMNDTYGRELNYLRVSVTSQCNLRCFYCMPKNAIAQDKQNDVLTFDEIARIVSIMAGLGVKRVRLTGGEPLARKNLPSLAKMIKEIGGISFLGLTTNGVMLAENADALYNAGVDGINLSMDTLNPQRYAEITGTNLFNKAWQGFESALATPFKSVKVNCVLAPGTTKQDWLGVAGLAQRYPVDVRFIEWMPMAGKPAAEITASFDDIFNYITDFYDKPIAIDADEKREAGPAQYYNVSGLKGRVGFIPAMSHKFCESCNRLRLTAQGNLKLCLFYDEGLSLAKLLRGGAADEEIAEAIKAAVQSKPKQHQGVLLAAEESGQCGGASEGTGKGEGTSANKKAKTGTIPHPSGMADIGG